MKARLQSSHLFVYLVIGLTASEIVNACAGDITTPQYTLAVTGSGAGSGSVTSSPSGIDCSIVAGGARDDCTTTYDENTLVTLTAAAGVGSTFDGWSGTCSGTGTCQVTMTQARSVTATFELIPPPHYQLTVDGAGTGSGGVTSDLAGISCTITAGVTSNDCNELYDENTAVTLTAAPAAGSTFDGWSGAGCSGGGTCQVTMTQALNVTVTFELIPPAQYQLTVDGAGTGSGGVTSDIAGINCTIAAGVTSNDCNELYDENTAVTLTAAPAAGSTFDGWSGAGCSGTGTCQVTMTQALGVTATFELIPPPHYQLTVDGAGTGSGGVTSDLAGISCTITAGVTSNDCNELYDENTAVTLTAAPAAGSTFDGWSGAGCSGGGTCQVTMTQALNVTVTFELIPPAQYQLTVDGAGTGSGGVTSDIAGINCTIAAGVTSNDCNELYDENTAVTLTAAPAAGSTFDGWSGAGCSGTGTCQVTMTQALGVTATFELIPPAQYQLRVAGAGTGNGGVSSDVAGISCTITAGVTSNDCNELYDENTAVTLTAAPAAGSTFDGWSSAGCSGTGTCQVTMSQAETVTATFELIPPPQYQLTVDGAGTGNGAVTSDIAGINCTITAGVTSNNCSELYDENTAVTLTAAADAGSTFDGWNGAGCSGTGTCQVTMTQALSVTATFELIPPPQYQLTVDGAGTGNGAVTSDIAGISCTIAAGVTSNDCSELYDENTSVTLTAAADAGSTFDGWSGAGCSGTGTCQVTMTQALSVTATFELIPPPQYQLTVDGAGTGNGAVTSDIAGINCTITAGVTSNNCSELYDENTAVTLTAAPAVGSTFDGWSSAGCSGTGTCQVTMSQALSVTATFELIPPAQYQLTVAGAGTGNGAVTSDIAGISCTIAAGVTSNDCSELYDENTAVTLTAAADAGSTLDGWSGAGCSGTGTCQVTMTQALNVTATFGLIPPAQYQLTVDGAGTGNGGVSSDIAGISCTIAAGVTSNDCGELYDENTAVTLTAAVGVGSTFDGWSGAGCSGTGTCQVTMTQELSVTATFELIPPAQYQLTVAGAGTGNGAVTSDIAGISCTIAAGVTSNDCGELYDENTAVTLTAAVGVGSTFDGWSGDCSGTGTCQLTMSQARSVTAAFSGCTLSTPGDADGDRLPDCVETDTRVFVGQLNTGTDPNDPDTDDDAIPDGDEVLGTLLGLDLPLMGVNPLRQDILLEYDWFDDALECGAHSHRPTIAALTMVTVAFASAPVVNPDNSTGINFIHDYGQGGVFTGGNLVADADGVLDGGVNGAEFQNYKNANFDANRNGYLHYTLLPHRYNTNSNSSGQAELPGDDMIVSLYCAGSDRNVAHTIVHELGHNLNIRHGGFENTNYKPNYNSVMNYKYQFPGIDSDCTPPGNGVLDYSVGVRPPLDENNLDETQGVCGNPPGPGWDWNIDGDATDVGLVFDINGNTSGTGDGSFGVLQDYNDWAFLILTGIGDADGAGIRLTSEVVSCTNPAPVERR